MHLGDGTGLELGARLGKKDPAAINKMYNRCQMNVNFSGTNVFFPVMQP